jgi:hypothetical protein
MTSPALLVAAAILLTGCGADDEPGATDDATPSVERANVASVAGEYDTEVELLDSSCAGIEVMDNPTTVEQDPGTAMIRLTHAGLTYTGVLEDDGRFATTAQTVEVGADTHQLGVTGTFDGDGFEATVAAQVTGGQTCDYQVSWVGTRQ